MTFLNVVIGYGIIASVIATDIDLSKRSCWSELSFWLIAVSALPLILIWNNRCRYTLLRQLRTPGAACSQPGGRRTGGNYGLGTDSFAGYPAEESGEGDRRGFAELWRCRSELLSAIKLAFCVGAVRLGAGQ